MRPLLLLSQLAVFSLAACGPLSTEDVNAPEDPAGSHLARRCFLRVTTSSDGSVVDSMSVQIVIDQDNGHVTGRLDRSQGAEDRMQGTLIGQLVGDRVIAMCTYAAVAGTNKDQRILILGSDHVSVITAQMEEKDGTWRMKDLDGTNDGIKVPEVPCPGS